jgi:hypothetical protein
MSPDGQTGLLPCPSFYALTDGVNGSLYRLVTASATWTAAEADCEGDEVVGTTQPTHLIVLDDSLEASFAWALTSSDQWFGSTDRVTEGNFLPVTDQQAVYTGPATGNNATKNCLFIHNAGGQTNADSCTNGHPYLCECDGKRADASHF